MEQYLIQKVVHKIGLPELYDLFVTLLLGPVIEITDKRVREEFYINFMGQKHGIHQSWVKDFDKKEDKDVASGIEYYHNGKLDGPMVYYRKNKDIMMKCYYKNGLQHGKYVHYRYNGIAWARENYCNGKKHGLWKSYYSDGREHFTIKYEHGEEIEKHFF